MPLFIVTGATGQLGHAIVKNLINLVPVEQIGATCRNPDKAADLAEAAAIILTQVERANGPTAPLTGSQALDFGDLTDIASGLLSRPITRQILSDDAFRKKLVGLNTPSHVVNIVLGLYIAARNGAFSIVDLMLAAILGRPPIAMQALMADKIET